MKRLHALAGLALFVTGCIPRSNLTPAGYAEGKVAYNVHYADPITGRRFVGNDWVLISHSTAGVPRDEKAVFHFDVDGDGKDDATRELPRYDLRLLHADGSRISIRRFVFGRPQATELHAWIRELARSISGTLWFEDRSRRWTSRMRDEADLSVAGQNAVQLTVDIADADRFALAPGVIDHRMVVVVAETPFGETVSNGLREHESYPVRLLVTYDAPPEVFEGHLSEFEQFLGEVEIRGARGVLRKAQPAPVTPPTVPAGLPAAATSH